MRLWLAYVRRTPLLLFLLGYTALTALPFLWVASMSLRTTSEILGNPYGMPAHPHWSNFTDAWIGSNYSIYFWNSAIVVAGAVAGVTIVGAMAAHCLARYRFRSRRAIRFVILSGLVLPPQMLILSLYQILLDYQLYDTLPGLAIVYVATQLGMTVYLLEGFFAQIPQDLFDAARMDGYSDFEIFWRITLPIGMPAIFTTVVLNFVILWNEFLYAVVLMTSDEHRTLPLGIMHFMGDHQLDVAMIATGLMIAIVPVALIYAFFSETMIRGMTAGAVR
jgi:multiple sugar transport system permease protein/raffinose/stachyose/melibiose transport system permease protein